MVERRKYSMATRLKSGFDETRQRTTEALAKQGFGILSEIDVAATMKKKLGVDFRPYVILGACNPPLAHQALEAERDLGLLMPCNVVIYTNDDGTCTVAAVDPVVQFSKVQNPMVEPVANEVRNRLIQVLEHLRDNYGAASAF
jgi:uncharacterized protein (DUF302 family)